MARKVPTPDQPLKSDAARTGPDTTDTGAKPTNAKIDSIENARAYGHGDHLTTNQGVPIADNQNSLKAGPRGPTLLEDFILREKITHFDHERIPERIVHARGSAAHGYFQVYEPMTKYTRAHFLQDPSVQTPVFVRFSTVAGSRGSADTVRDVRGFAVKFYTQEGNYDLVGNNIPVFFIQDAIKFPDFVHSVKPEPHNEMPQASSAHDTLWDFVSLVPETLHMVLWAMSDRAIPRSLRMMEGFGVHTFRLLNARGEATFVKFHWKPLLGIHSLAWDEAQKLAGKDADFHRRDLWEAIENGDYPEWELGMQLIPEADEFKFDFDLLDATKLVPEELVPVIKVGKLTLNRNPDNFFAETEQAAFHPGHVVPGIDFTNDPLLQGRIFSYLDTQLSRLGGPNFHQIPINRAICPFHNNQRDGLHQHTIHQGRVAYEPSSVGRGSPQEVPPERGGFVSYTERIDAHKVRERSASFADHFSQATLFWHSQAPHEQDHIVSAFQFELGKLESPLIRQRVVDLLVNVDATLAQRVASKLNIVPGAPDPAQAQKKPKLAKSAALSMAKQPADTIKTRKIAILAADGVDGTLVNAMVQALTAAGGQTRVIGPHLGTLTSVNSDPIPVDATPLTMPSIMFDAVFVPDGAASVTALLGDGAAVHFVLEAYKHAKAVAGVGDANQLLAKIGVKLETAPGVVAVGNTAPAAEVAARFIQAIARHRFWERTDLDGIPA